MSSYFRLVSASIVLALSAAAHAAEALPLPRMVVAKTAVPPIIDGQMSTGEWDRATAATAFVTAFENTLSKVQTVVWVTYDDTYLYVCLKNYRGENYKSLRMVGRKPDDGNIVFDYANEIWVTPPSQPQETFQTMFNAYPGFFDVKMIPSLGNQSSSWTADWKVASSQAKDYWIVEGRARLDAYSKAATTDGTVWRALFTTDVIGGAGFTAWAPGGAFVDIPRHGLLEFRATAPTVQCLDVTSLRTGKAALPFAVTGPGAVTVTCQLPGAELTRTVTLPAGKREEFVLATELKATNGVCAISAKTADGLVLFSQSFPFVVDGFIRQAPAEIVTNPYGKKPFGFTAQYAPLSKQLICKIDRLYLSRRTEAVSGVARVIDPATKKVVAERPIAPFRYDYSEFVVDLSKLTVPVETDDLWRQNQAVIASNKHVAADKQKPLPFPGAPYTVELVLTTAEGAEVARTTEAVVLKGFSAEWLNNSIGISDKVIPPWTPIVEGGRGEFSLWNKRYTLNALGLAERIVNGGQPQLAGPMRLIATVNGKSEAVPAAAPKLAKRLAKDAGVADLTGLARAGDLRFETQTRLEFDGCVVNTMTVTPAKPVQLDGLTLEVRMPKTEAPFYVTTAGGWTSSFGDTPSQWTCRETSIGGRQAAFVPYLVFTDSERGFTLFADNDQGWILDPAKASQEFVHEGDMLVVRFHFVNRPGLVEKPFTVRYGWMATPQKPQPSGWRACEIDFRNSRPQVKTVFFADPYNSSWWFVYPYYSSPFPLGRNSKKIGDYEEFAKDIAHDLDNPSFILSAGNIMHSIGRYVDYKGRDCGALAAEWGVEPGVAGMCNVALGRGPNDFRVWHMEKAVRLSGLKGLYFDETYLGEDYNYLNGGAYLLPDGRVEPGYHFLGLRDFSKRLRYMFHAAGKPLPNLWYHTTGQHPVYAWLNDVSWEGENVMPGGRDHDYLEAHPASRLRSIGMGRNLGTVPMIFCQANQGFTGSNEDKDFLTHQFVGWVLAHDCIPTRDRGIYSLGLLPELELWDDKVQFLPYWKTGQGVNVKTKDVIASAHVRSANAVLWVVNTARADQAVALELDLAKLQVTGPGRLLCYDVETGEPVALQRDGDTATLAANIPARLWRGVRLRRVERLSGTQTFSADFEDGAGVANEALGCRFPSPGPVTSVAGKTGKGMSLDQPLAYNARLHVGRSGGEVSYQLRYDLAAPRGGFLFRGKGLDVSLGRGTVMFCIDGKNQPPFKMDGVTAGVAWHEVSIRWTDKATVVRIDGREVARADSVPRLPDFDRGVNLDAHDAFTLKPNRIILGPIKGAIMDDLSMSRIL